MSGAVTVLRGDCRRAMRLMARRGIRVDSIVCDPPYHLTSIVKRFGGNGAAAAKDRDGLYKRASAGFMGQQWDGGDIAFDPETWALAAAVLKPGGHLLAFGGTRGWHRMARAIEDAGFEIRDSILDMIAADDPARLFMESLTEAQADAFLRCIEDSQFGGFLAWLYGSGFPKSHDVSKGIDKAAGVEREVVGNHPNPAKPAKGTFNASFGEALLTAPATPAAAAWGGWGTALKPAFEPIVLARLPLGEKSVAANVLRHGTGAINVDGCRVGTTRDVPASHSTTASSIGATGISGKRLQSELDPNLGRWPANVAHDGGAEVEAAFAAFGERAGAVSNGRKGVDGACYGHFGDMPQSDGRCDSGSASRFFYSAKAGPDDRFGSKHPTVKPVALMRWLVRMINPPGGLVLDPFAGSGSTGIAALAEGMRAILCEREAGYAADIRARLDHYAGKGGHSASVKARHKEPPKDHGPLFGEVTS
jgi:site-specific DNA-methyltransferase (adenine-specific)